MKIRIILGLAPLALTVPSLAAAQPHQAPTQHVGMQRLGRRHDGVVANWFCCAGEVDDDEDVANQSSSDDTCGLFVYERGGTLRQPRHPTVAVEHQTGIGGRRRDRHPRAQRFTQRRQLR